MNLDPHREGNAEHRAGPKGGNGNVMVQCRQIVAGLLRDEPPGRVGTPRVLWRDDAGKVRTAEVTRALTLGRAPGCAVELTHQNVSWVHALLGPNESTFWIVDLSSTTGTTVNGNRVGEVISPLRSGDVIELGGFPVAFLQ